MQPQQAPDPLAATVDALQQLVRTNHGLLNALGVGHEALDQVCATTRRHGFESKLTGAGGGGCAFTVLEDASAADVEINRRATELAARLQEQGFACYRSAVAGPGVLWTDPGDAGPKTEPAPEPKRLAVRHAALVLGVAAVAFVGMSTVLARRHRG